MTMTTAQLIRHYRELRGLNQSELARRIGISPQAVQHWEHGNAEPRSKLLPKIAQVLGLEPRDLAHGAPLRSSVTQDVSASYVVDSLDTAPHDASYPTVMTPLPRLTRKVVDFATGVQIRNLHTGGPMGREVELIVVSPDWVARRLPGRNPTSIVVLEAYGGAMAPTLAQGDWVFIDASQRVLDYDAVWVLRHHDTREIWIRRVQRRPDGSWLLLYDNPRYQALEVPPAERQRFEVLGQAVMGNNLRVM